MQSCEGKGTERVGLGGPRSEDSFRKELTSKGGRQGKVETECQLGRRKRNALKSGSIGKLGKKMSTKLGLLPLPFNASLRICLGKARDPIRRVPKGRKRKVSLG
ncbi:hypothetical protein OIU84_002869 [Salix udensis]|uniref:Uncharacterized protein n=1 Tax=Salix udensis TaxID=889485 RepID=A0AAD6P574_9ROSI|nr:hypothetical protein OIU84_002869 [Salix udensis]